MNRTVARSGKQRGRKSVPSRRVKTLDGGDAAEDSGHSGGARV